MITFKEFLILAESSTPEKGKKRTLPPQRGERTRRSDLNARTQRTDLVALRKAGFRGKPDSSPYAKDHFHTSSKHHSTNIATNKSQIDYANRKMPSKNIDSLISRGKPTPTAQRVRAAKEAIRTMSSTGNRTKRAVHDVSVHANDDIEHISKNNPKKLVSRGKSFKQEVGSTFDAIKNVGGKTGDIAVADPQAAMPGENAKQGAKKRTQVYRRQFRGSRTNPRTGTMSVRVSE